MTVRTKQNRWIEGFWARLPHAFIAIFAMALYLSDSLTLIDNKLADLGSQLQRHEATGDVVLVEIDAKSIDALEVWPWPRRLHARVLDNLLDAGARRVAFDIDFSARSRAEEDKILAEALSRAGGNVILPVFSQLSQSADGKIELKQSVPIPAFRRHATLASINVRPEFDSLIRTMSIRDNGYPSLAAVLANQEDANFGAFQIDFGIQLSTIPRLSFVDVLKGRFDASKVAGKQIVIGSTAVELGDQLAVPVYRTVPGPLIHIFGYESLAQDRALVKVAAPPIAVGVLVLTLLLGPLFLKWPWKKALMVYLAVLAGLIGLSFAVHAVAPVLIDVAPLALAVLLSFSFAVVKRIDQQALRLIFQNIDIRRKDEMMRNVVENSFDGILTMDIKGVIESANPAAAKILANDEADIVGHPIEDFFPALRGISHRTGLIAALQVGQEPHELTGRCRDDRSLPIELSVSLLETDDQTIFTMFFRDITDRKQQQANLEHQASHDALTGLPNRKFFYDRLHDAIAQAPTNGPSFAVLLLDLDRFKEVNDTLGHPTGDELLKKIADRLQTAIPESDMIARIGGDEFALLLPSTSTVAGATDLARNILALICEPFDIAGLTLDIAGSVGIAMYPQHGEDGSTLVQRADVAMYMAKRAQSGIEVYDEEKDQNSVRFLTLSGDLRRAIDEGQLVLHYQPKICLKQNRVIAVEALIRWNHPEHGFIAPDDFIDKAEQTGVIRPMTEWVLNTALRQAAEWRRKGIELDIAVNISARLLGDFEIVKMVYPCLRKWRVPPSSVILEVTENALMDDPTKAMDVITALSNLGPRISIDDFGTGYSSLGYLKDFPADELKIDKCFVQSLNENKGDETIVRSTLGLAHGLGMKVVAEGIETAEVCAMLTKFDCDVGQGYYFSKPLPIAEFDEWLATSPWGAPLATTPAALPATDKIMAIASAP